jgi:hypothetical protein
VPLTARDLSRGTNHIRELTKQLRYDIDLGVVKTPTLITGKDEIKQESLAVSVPVTAPLWKTPRSVADTQSPIKLEYDPEQCLLTIEDNGIGYVRPHNHF